MDLEKAERVISAGKQAAQEMGVININVIKKYNVKDDSNISLWYGWLIDTLFPPQVNFCLAVMDTGVNMVAFARMDTCPVSIFHHSSTFS